MQIGSCAATVRLIKSAKPGDRPYLLSRAGIWLKHLLKTPTLQKNVPSPFEALTDTSLSQFVQTWQGKQKDQVVEEISSYCLETRRIADPYYFSFTPEGELFSPQADCRIKDVVERNTRVGQLEYKALQNIEAWADRNSAGTIAWISPPAVGIYPTSKLVISEIEQRGENKVLFNRAIVLDIGEERCLRLARDLVDFSTNRPLLSSLDQIRSNPLVLNTHGIHWTYILEELMEDLNLESVRQGEDKRIKEETILQAREIYRDLFTKTGRVDIGRMVFEINQAAMIGDYFTSCPIVFGGQTAFQFFFGNSLNLTKECSKIKCGQSGCSWEASDEDARKIVKKEMNCCPKCGWKPG